tara:strand:+ start:127 stop:3813 length:3687 start_codon:yes stop_codon:yes gene_type:complete
MEALSPYSRIFTDVLDELGTKVDNNELQTPDEKRDFIKSKGIDPELFKKTADEYYSIIQKGPISEDELNRPGSAVGRVVGSALGKVGEAVKYVGKEFFPETTKAIGETYTRIEPNAVERVRQEVFFPTLSDKSVKIFGAEIPIEETTAEIGSYLVPASGVIKGINVGTKALNLAKLGSRAGKVGKAVKYGTGYAVGTTLIEKPEDNIVNFLVNDFGTSKVVGDKTINDLIGNLKVNPDDSASAKYLQSFINNLITEGVFAGTLAVTAKGLTKLPVKDFAKNVGSTVKKTTDYVIPQKLKDVAKEINKTRKEYFSSRMGLSDDALGLLVEREGAAKAAITRASILTDKLKSSVKKEYGRKQSDELLEKINEALAGGQDQLQALKPETQKVIKDMRTEIKKLSQYTKDNIAVEGSGLDVVIGKNLDTYLNRSYRIFDDPTYFKNIDPQVQERARLYFKRQGIDEKDIDSVMEYYTKGVTKQELNSFLSTVSPRTSRILKQRKDIPVEIRNLWGEVKNPYKNFANTYTKLAGVKSEFDFRKQIVEEAKRVGKATTERNEKLGFIPAQTVDEATGQLVDTKGFVQSDLRSLGGSGSKGNVKNPLADLFIDPSWKAAIEGGTDVMFGEGKFMQSWMKLKALSQAQKTVFSIPTHGRNFLGNMFIMTANGTMNPKYLAQGSKDTFKRLTGLTDSKLKERLARYQELGIVDSALDSSSLRKAAGEGFRLGTNGMVDKAVNDTITGKVLSAPIKKTVQLYEAEDNLFKIANFEQLKKGYRNLFPKPKKLANESDEIYLKKVKDNEIAFERFVAQRSRDMMPNYNLVPKAIKSLRAAPVGNFVAFPAEILRTSKNLAKYAWKDISGTTAKELGITDPKIIKEIKNMGLKRLAGMSAVAVSGGALSDFSKMLFNISDDQEEVMNNSPAVPAWERGMDKIFTGEIKKNKDGDLEVPYMNLGPIDPYAYLKAPVKLVSSAIINGLDYNEEAINDMYLTSLGSLIGPFANPSLVAQAALDLYSGKRLEPGGDLQDNAISIAKVLGQTLLVPGTVDFFTKRKAFYDSQQQRGVGREVNEYGFTIAPGEVDIAAFLGVQRKKMNLNTAFNFSAGNVLREANASKLKFKNELRKFNVQSEDDVYNAYADSQKNKLKQMKRLRNVIKSYRILGMSDSDIIKSLTKGGLVKNKKQIENIILADNNIFRPDRVSRQDFKMSKFRTGAPLPLEKIFELQNKLQNESID